MQKILANIASQLPSPELPPHIKAAGESLKNIIDFKAYVGEVVSLGYSEAIVQIHDFHRQQVGGIPAMCFLIATRVVESSVDIKSNAPD